MATVEWTYLVLWLPLAGLALSGLAAWRTGWRALALSALAWATIGFVVFGLALPGASVGAGALTALFVFFIPWLCCGGVVLFVRQRRRGQRTASPR